MPKMPPWKFGLRGGLQVYVNEFHKNKTNKSRFQLETAIEQAQILPKEHKKQIWKTRADTREKSRILETETSLK